MFQVLLVFISIFSMGPLYPKSYPAESLPTLYAGRYRPSESYAKIWLKERYGLSAIKPSHLQDFHLNNQSALGFLWQLQVYGHGPWDHAPLFQVNEEISLKKHYLSYQELISTLGNTKKDDPELRAFLTEFGNIKGSAEFEDDYMILYQNLKEQKISKDEIDSILNDTYPLQRRLKESGVLFKMLPNKFKQGEWIPLNALKLKVYHSEADELVPINNFTLFSNAQFQSIREAYIKWEQAVINKTNSEVTLETFNRFNDAMAEGYQNLEGTPYRETQSKALYYPTYRQLRIETWYSKLPWLEMLIFLYGLSAFCFITGYCKTGVWTLLLAFLLHSGVLLIRVYLLGRPPVSNMHETVIYVPWIGALFGGILYFYQRHNLIPIVANCTCLLILGMSAILGGNHQLEPVPAVLDSQFWLMIHVLMVVASYGIFLFASLLGHVYMGQLWWFQKENSTTALLAHSLLQSLYVGTGLLIGGTILGGVWAAQSWGRFWDWDPKESWAFISSCFYLICIHAYRFHYIARFGLAMGAIVGFLSISFTWYGVNYLLGTGLHSYGFGSGGVGYYLSFILAECLLLWYIGLVYKKTKKYC